MDKEIILREIEKLLEIEPNTITKDTLLEDVEEWDSMAAVSFLAMCDANFGKMLNPINLKACKSFGDLVDLI